jgi:hypothetical protein
MKQQMRCWKTSRWAAATFSSRAARIASTIELIATSIGVVSLPSIALASNHSIVTLWDGATFFLPTELPIGYGFTGSHTSAASATIA